MTWTFFPEPTSVFADGSGQFFVPLGGVDLGSLLPGGVGPVWWLRPRYDPEGLPVAHDDPDWPADWFPFRRDPQGRLTCLVELSCKVEPEQTPYMAPYLGNRRAQYRAGEIAAGDLLETAHVPALSINVDPAEADAILPEGWPRSWPNANWCADPDVQTDKTRHLVYLGALDTTSFGPGDCDAALLCDPRSDLFVIVLDWS